MEEAQKDTPKRGRPAKEENKLSYSINVKLTEVDFEAVKQKAESIGMKTTQYARQMILNGRIKPHYTKEELDLRRKIAGMANNLNQLARKANTDGYRDAAYRVTLVLEQIKDLLDDR